MSEIPYKNLIIYFWSGTGNSYRVSTIMGEIAEKNSLNTRVCMIDNFNIASDIRNRNDDLVGIVFPTHGFTAPWYILKSVWKMPGSNSAHVFIVSTRAGLKFGKVFIPGISGSAVFIIALIMFLKGYSVRGFMSVDMPSNWYSLHPIQSRESQTAIIDRAKIRISQFMVKILQGSKEIFTVNNLCEIVWGVLLSLISLGYLLIGRIFLAKLFFANKKCDGCAICADFCSVNAVKMVGKTNPKPFWKYNCESCMRCSAFCPRDAIEAGHSWGVILYFIMSVPAAAYVISLFIDHYFGIKNFETHWSIGIINFLFYYPAIFISYYIFNKLVNIPAFNRIFTHTTLTHLPFWKRYREPGTRLKDIGIKRKE